MKKRPQSAVPKPLGSLGAVDERRDIFLRAHTVRVVEKPRKLRRKKEVAPPEKWPDRALIFDTETRTTVDQTLMFAIYRICRLVGDRYACEEEGIAYSGSVEKLPLSYSAVLDKEELNSIGSFVADKLTEVEIPSFPPKIKFKVHQSFPAFTQKVFGNSVRRGDLIVCFNSPWDLSRIALGWRPFRRRTKRAFSLIMSKQFERKTQSWRSHPYYPEIHIEAKDARSAFISRGMPWRGKKKWNQPGRFLDLSVLLFSLFDEHKSLDAWCEQFGLEGKLKSQKDGQPCTYDPSGRVTKDELEYCWQDVRITQKLLNAAKREFDLHPLPTLLPDKSYSPASIAKAYMREMKITPPAEKFKPSNEILGIAMQGYFGGRAECHIRRTRVPVMRLDFLSQYPTVNTLLNNWEILTADSVSFPDATDEVQNRLNKITLDACFDPELWRECRFFALVQPDHDIFPVRAAYNDRDLNRLNIGVNFLTSGQRVWVAGPDIVAAVIQSNGKVPQIQRAIKIVPHGKQSGLKPVNLRSFVRVNPNEDDFFKHIIEQRKAHESDKELKHALKIIANSGAYGLFVQLDERIERKQARLDVYSGQHYHNQPIRELEVPGPWYFPPLAALITSGGRLLLAMAEKCVTDARGTWLFCDTDSIAVVASKRAGDVRGAFPEEHDDLALRKGLIDKREFAPVPVISHDEVTKISARFASLNPYRFPGTILKVEDVNHEDEDSRKPLRVVQGYAISAKRYCLFTGMRGTVNIIDAKAHGIGYLMPPKIRDRKNDEDHDWIEEFWESVLQNEGISFSGCSPEWLDRPAMMKIPVSSPAVLGRLKNFVKPYDFVLAPIISDTELDEQAEKPILVTRFTKKSEEWLNATYYNVRTGKPCSITVGQGTSPNLVPVKSYRQILNAYVNNPESKFLGPGGNRCNLYTRGILQRDHVITALHRYCGKEFKRKLEQGPVDHEIAFKCRVYENGRVTADPETLRQLAEFTEREIANGTGLHRKPIRLFRHGGTVTRRTHRRIMNFLKEQSKRAQ